MGLLISGSLTALAGLRIRYKVAPLLKFFLMAGTRKSKLVVSQETLGLILYAANVDACSGLG